MNWYNELGRIVELIDVSIFAIFESTFQDDVPT